MKLNTNIQSVMIQFLKVKELKQIQTINKNFHNDLIKNKKTIQNMIKYETFLFQRSFLYDAISERIVNILLIKYDTIETIYNKYKNIDYHQYYSSPHYTLILKDIFDLMIDNQMKMVCLDNRSLESINPNKLVTDCCDFDKEYKKGNAKIWYNTPNRVVAVEGQACMDDSAFFADMDYLRKNFWDDVYMSLPTVHKGEEYVYVVKKYSDDTVRFHVEKSLFRNINIVGTSSGGYTVEYLFNQVCLFLGR
jgi:hypothetical protein